jgi:hypothetical protein
MGGVMVPVVDVIHMIAVGHRLMPAPFAMHVVVGLMQSMRQVMLVVMALVGDVRVPLMDVVKVPLVLDGGVPALRTVNMVVLDMGIVPGGHGSSSPLGVVDRARLIPTAVTGFPA